MCSPMAQAAWKATLRKLEKRAAQLQEEYDDLSCVHDLLSCRESVYNAWCKGLSVLDHLAAGTPATRKALGSCYPQLAALQQQEQLLIQQLADSGTETDMQHPEGEEEPHPAASGAFDAGAATIAPLSDPLQYFRQIAVQPRMPESASMTVVDLSQLYKSVVMDMSMQLHLMHNGFEVVAEDQAVLRIKAGWDRCALLRAGSMHPVSLHVLGPALPIRHADTERTFHACIHAQNPGHCLSPLSLRLEAVLITCPCTPLTPTHPAGTSKPWYP